MICSGWSDTDRLQLYIIHFQVVLFFLELHLLERSQLQCYIVISESSLQVPISIWVTPILDAYPIRPFSRSNLSQIQIRRPWLSNAHLHL